MRTLYLLTAITLVIETVTPVKAQKSLSIPYLVQAKKLLPTVGIELDPGDGGEVASAGKLLYENLLPLYVKLALAQKQTGDAAGAQATLARAQALCTDKKGTYQGLVTLLVNEGLQAGFYNESVAFHKKHDIDGFRAPLRAEYEITVRKDAKAATAALLAGIERGKSLETKGKALEKGSDDRWTRLTTLFKILDCAVRHSLPEASSSARTALIPYVKDLTGIELCQAVFLGVPEISPADAEAKLLAEPDNNGHWGLQALGFFYLKKETKARAALSTLGKNKNGDQMVPTLLFFLKPAEFATLASAGMTRTTLDYLRQEGRETPETVLVLQKRLLENPSLSAAQRTAEARKEFLEIYKDNQKRAYTKGSYQYSASQSQYAEMLTALIPLDVAFAAAQLAKIAEPRYRLVVLTELVAYYAKKK
ncbi:hypothetical protein [Armatimonas sp.]|uniref:hypothetical protein n=1 Tax=Armatimonas sp. TaxID=1872638 RepID=UPI00286AD214|nr:hypothetical protein [Armatimonas sp.]